MAYHITNRPRFEVIGRVEWKSNGNVVRYDVASIPADDSESGADKFFLCNWFERATEISSETMFSETGDRHWSVTNPVIVATVKKTVVTFADGEKVKGSKLYIFDQKRVVTCL